MLTPLKNPKSKAITEATKQFIVKRVTEDLISPSKLADEFKFDVRTIRSWVKNSGAVLPLKYTQSESSKSEVLTS